MYKLIKSLVYFLLVAAGAPDAGARGIFDRCLDGLIHAGIVSRLEATLPLSRFSELEALPFEGGETKARYAGMYRGRRIHIKVHSAGTWDEAFAEARLYATLNRIHVGPALIGLVRFENGDYGTVTGWREGRHLRYQSGLLTTGDWRRPVPGEIEISRRALHQLLSLGQTLYNHGVNEMDELQILIDRESVTLIDPLSAGMRFGYDTREGGVPPRRLVEGMVRKLIPFLPPGETFP